jgi:hypothetical protein
MWEKVMLSPSPLIGGEGERETENITSTTKIFTAHILPR